MKSERGAISLFVLIAMLFFTIYTMYIYVSATTSQSTQLRGFERIKSIYEEDINDIDEIYKQQL